MSAFQNPAEENLPEGEVSYQVQRSFFSIGLMISLGLFGFAVYFMWSALAYGGRWGISEWLALITAGMFLVVMGRWCIGLGLSFWGFGSHQDRLKEPTSYPYVSIFVPCYNEGGTITAALESLLELDYPNYEVIVVNDGSKDDTLIKAKRFEGTFGGVTVRVLDKPNGGKWSAHNLAFHHSVGEVIMCVDADTRFEPGAIRRLLARFEEDPRIAVVAGQTRVRNQDRLITKMQNLEYQIYNGIIRLSQNLSGTVLCVPGPLGLFRRSAMEEVCYRFPRTVDLSHPGRFIGPFEADTFSEDFDLSASILTLGYRVVYEPHGIAYTNVPADMRTLINQRYRWYRGNMQVLRKMFRRACGQSVAAPFRVWGWTAFTYLIDLALVPLFALLVPILYAITLMQLADGSMGQNAWFYLGWIAAVQMMGISLCSFFLALHRERLRPNNILLVCFFDMFWWILIVAGLVSLVDEIRAKKMRW